MSFWEKTSAWIKKLEELSLVGFAFFGFGLIRFWLIAMQSLPEQTAAGQGGAFGVLLFRGLQIIALIFLALMARKTRSLHHRGPVVVGAAGAMVLAAALLGVAIALPHVAWLVSLATFFGALGYSGMFLLWLELYGCLPSDKMLAAYAGSNLVAALLWEMLSSLNPVVLAVIAAIIPALSLMMLIVAYHKPEAARGESLPEGNSQMPGGRDMWRLFAWVACFGLAAGFFTFGGGKGIMLAHIIVGLILLAGLAVWKAKFDSSILYRLALPCMVLGLITSLIDGADGFARMAISVGKECSLAIAFVVVCNVAYRRKVTAAWGAGLLSACNMAALAAGNLLHHHATGICDALGITPVVIVVSLCFLCCLTSTLIYTENHFFLQWDETALASGRTVAQAENVRKAVVRLAGEAGLSSREEEVVLLLALGKTSDEICDELFISSGTLRAHMSRIYAKFDVHSREDLERILREHGAFAEE